LDEPSEDSSDDNYDDIIIPSKPKVTDEPSEDENVDVYDDVDVDDYVDDDVDVDDYDNVIIPSKPKVTTPSKCIKKHSVPKCGKCQSHDQCGQGSFCCPYMKKCVQS